MNTLVYPYLIRDALHGDIVYTELEKKVIDHPLFQRLRNISQLGFLKYIFPSATHSRFEHSLGVLHLSGRALTSLIRNQERIYFKAYSIPIEIKNAESWLTKLKSPTLTQLFRLAALVHDLGHGPLSHASEILTEKIEPNLLLEGAPSWLRVSFQKKLERGDKVKHEWMSALMTHHLFEAIGVTGSYSARDVVAILDSDVELEADSILHQTGLRPLLHELITGEIDVDRMDYLQRDSYFSGVNYGIYDADRLFSSILFGVNKEGFPKLILHRQGLHAFEDFLFSRYQMYLQVYTHKTNTAFEVMLAQLSEKVKVQYPTDLKGFINFKDSSFPAFMQAGLEKSPGEDAQSKAGQLFKDLFEERKPWKMAYEKLSFSETIQNPESRLQLPELKNLGQLFMSRRKLSSLSIRPEINPSISGLKLWDWDALGDETKLFDLREKSYVLRTFEHFACIDRFFVPERDLMAAKKMIREANGP